MPGSCRRGPRAQRAQRLERAVAQGTPPQPGAVGEVVQPVRDDVAEQTRPRRGIAVAVAQPVDDALGERDGRDDPAGPGGDRAGQDGRAASSGG